MELNRAGADGIDLVDDRTDRRRGRSGLEHEGIGSAGRASAANHLDAAARNWISAGKIDDERVLVPRALQPDRCHVLQVGGHRLLAVDDDIDLVTLPAHLKRVGVAIVGRRTRRNDERLGHLLKRQCPGVQDTAVFQLAYEEARNQFLVERSR